MLPIKQNKKFQKGFTLVELLVVIGILTTLLAITLIAINPSRQFDQANDTQRRSDVLAILNAINQYMADNDGATPTGVDGCTTACPMDASAGVGTVDICSALVPTYIAEMPVDPETGSFTDCTTYDTQYEVAISGTSNRITVSAPDAALGTVSSTR